MLALSSENRSCAQGRHVVCGYRALEAAQRELAHVLYLDPLLDLAEYALRDQHLAGLRLAAQARGEIGDRPDRAVVAPFLEADRAERGVAVGDPDAEAEVVAALLPACGQRAHLVAHLERHADRGKLM